MSFGLGFWATAGAGGGAGAGAYEQIATTILSSNTASISFSSIAQTYAHLQIRMVAQNSDVDAANYPTYLAFNGNTTNYGISHFIQGEGSSVTSQTFAATSSINLGPTLSGNANVYSSQIVDILDYVSTSKNKTVKSFNGYAAPGGYTRIRLSSGLFTNTSAISSLVLTTQGSFTSGSRFSLYGIRG